MYASRVLRGLILTVLLSLAAVAASGCEKPPAKSVVAQGQLYTSGNAKFDPLFARIYAAQSQPTPPSEEEHASRKPLEKLFAPQPMPDDRTLFAAVGKRVVALGGTGFRLDASGSDAKVVAHEGTKKDPALVKASEEATRLELAHHKRVRARITDLEDIDREIDHATLEAKRHGDETSPDVRRELAAGASSIKKHLAAVRKADGSEAFLTSLAFALSGNRPKTRPAPPPRTTPPAGTPPPPVGPLPPPQNNMPAPDETTPRTIEPLPPPRPPEPHAANER